MGPPVRGDARHARTLARAPLRAEARERFPEKVTAFREGMAVHGRYGEPWPPVRHEYFSESVTADNETTTARAARTGGRVLADRGLSRLLGADWPRTSTKLEKLAAPLI